MKSTLVLAAAITVATSQLSPAQDVPKPVPAATKAEIGEAAANEGSLQFRSLQAVLDARERRQDWHQAAQEAVKRIDDLNLRRQFNQRLAGLVPTISKALMAHPQDDALVTVAVYRDQSKPSKQEMVAVTFDGLGSQIGRQFFADVLAGMPTAPEGEGIPRSLTLDTEATSYLVFFMGKNQILAGDVPHPVMGRSVVAMVNKQREADQAGSVAAAPPANANTATGRQPAPADVAHPEVGDVNANSDYVNTNPYPPVNDGYYYPSAVGVPIVILPNEFPATPEIVARQRQRQMELERRHQQNFNAPNSENGLTTAAPNANAAQNGNTNTPRSGNYNQPQSGNTVTPRSGNTITPRSGNTVQPRSGNYNTPQSGNHVSPQNGGNRSNGTTPFPKAGEPGGPPVHKNDNQQQHKTTPPAGAPGGPPAQSDKK